MNGSSLPMNILTKIRLVDGPLPEPCWEWTGARDADGYGRLGVNGNNRKAARVTYTILRGPISKNLELDHLCRNRACVNPSHLEQVPHEINVARGNAGIEQSNRTHCSQGHPFDSTNTYSYSGKRGCIICRRERSRKHRLMRENYVV